MTSLVDVAPPGEEAIELTELRDPELGAGAATVSKIRASITVTAENMCLVELHLRSHDWLR
jgi:hypothetical protein